MTAIDTVSPSADPIDPPTFRGGPVELTAALAEVPEGERFLVGLSLLVQGELSRHETVEARAGILVALLAFVVSGAQALDLPLSWVEDRTLELWTTPPDGEADDDPDEAREADEDAARVAGEIVRAAGADEPPTEATIPAEEPPAESEVTPDI